MQDHFESLLEDPAYKAWFAAWWEADFSIKGCESKGLDWWHFGSRPVAFGGREWSSPWAPPHTPEGEPNPLFGKSTYDWQSHLEREIQLRGKVARFDGAWLSSLRLNDIHPAARLSGRRAFVAGDLMLQTMKSLDLDLGGIFVSGKTHLIHLDLAQPALLTGAYLAGDVVLRRVREHPVRLNKARVGGSIHATEPTHKIDVSGSQICGDLDASSQVEQLDARTATILGGLQLTGLEVAAYEAQLGRARIEGNVSLVSPQVENLDLRSARINGHVTVQHGHVGTIRAQRLRVRGAFRIQGSSLGSLNLSSAHLASPVVVADATLVALALRRTKFRSSAAITQCHIGQVEAQEVDHTQSAVYSGCRITSTANFESAHFRDTADFTEVAFHGRTSFANARFPRGAGFSAGPATDDRVHTFAAISFAGATFSPPPGRIWCADFDGRDFTGLTLFDDCVFVGAPRFFEVDFHEDVSFRRCVFRRAPSLSPAIPQKLTAILPLLRTELKAWSLTQQQYENAYRALRMRMSEVGAAREEHRFLAKELRARRWRLDPEVGPHEMIISILYDMTSAYGESIFRPLLATAAIVFASATLTYATTTPAVGWSDAFDFASTQVFRPFNVWADKGDIILSTPQAGLDASLEARRHDVVAPLWLKFAASVQSLCCITLLFLAALAVRRRFRLG